MPSPRIAPPDVLDPAALITDGPPSARIGSLNAASSGRGQIEQGVEERAKHRTAEQVQTTCSFARAERLLGREYHGRFLIELLQNAADAWRLIAEPGKRSSIRVVLDCEGPALVVANKGAPLQADVVLESLGHIGRSTKAQGEAIGHKGIGFKSVLEISMAPELYSGLGQLEPSLAVRFDAKAALTQIRSTSPGWDGLLAEITDVTDPLDAIPVLRFPQWVDGLPPIVDELAQQGFDTVIRLPFVGPGTVVDWLKTVRSAFDDVTDQMLLLLGTFDSAMVEDRVAATSFTVAPHWHLHVQLLNGVSREDVMIQRNGELSSRWHLYRHGEPGTSGLGGETAVGVRFITDESGLPAMVAPLQGEAGTPFHLFFPTKIGSGLPLLLHGYFEVDAARTGFYEGSADRNDAILDSLSQLAVTAFKDLADSGAIDLVSVVDLIARTPPPENAHARCFRDGVLERLDEVAWVPLAEGGEQPRRACTEDLLLSKEDRLDQALFETFPVAYLERRSGLRVPHPKLGEAARELLVSRQPDTAADVWQQLELLLRPGDESPWVVGTEDAGFRRLLDLVTLLQVIDGERAEKLLGGLRGDDESRLLPVPSEDGSRKLYSLPAPEEGVRGRPGSLVMGRVRDAGVAPLQPPSSMNVVFLPDGLLTNEADGDRAKPLGVRPFTVDTVLDRLGGAEGQHEETLTFLWTLLGRERGSEFGTASGARLAASFDPAQWFWCQPGRAELTDNDRAKQRRQHRLSDVRLPARDGSWQPAGTLAFGEDWGEWLQNADAVRAPALAARAHAYRALEQIAPSVSTLLGAPESVLPWLPSLTDLVDDEPDVDTVAATRIGVQLARPSLELDEVSRNRERHAFLLRLGVWEVIPVEAFESRTELQNAERPWKDLREHLHPGGDDAPWNFEGQRWGGRAHQRVTISEDFRLVWPLEQADVARRIAVANCLVSGAELYAQLTTAAAFCPKCSGKGGGHTVRYRTGREERRPSTLALQLEALPWLPTLSAGEVNPEGARPSRAWWAERPPSTASIANSPLRFLRLCHPEAATTTELRQLVGLTDIAHAPVSRLQGLLLELRDGIESRSLKVDRAGGGRQALIGLHRLAYERLSELGDDGVAVLDRTGVLCELFGDLVFRSVAEARHDDGRYATYRRHFGSVVPFVTLARDKGPVANRLGLMPFDVAIRRQGDEPGTDVTGDLADALTDRIPELLAVLVHHSLGAQTLEPSSNEFEARSRRLQALTVRQVPDLILDVEAVSTGVIVTIGQGSVQDLFLEGPTTLTPVLFHDFDGPNWPSRIRGRLAAHLATLVESAAYRATFQLLLLAETDGERESVLHEIGISSEDVEAVRARLGAVTEEDRRSYLRWFSAVSTAARGGAHPKQLVDASPHNIESELVAAGLPQETANALVLAGGGQQVRCDSGNTLRLLLDAGVDLGLLDRLLREAGDRGLEVNAATAVLRGWKSQHGRRLVAVLTGTGVNEAAAKTNVDLCASPSSLAFALDPSTEDVLEPVITLLRTADLNPDISLLARDPLTELVRLAGVNDADELDVRVAALYNDEERRSVLARLAAAWRTEIVFLGALSRSIAGETRDATRGHADAVRALLPTGPATPSDMTGVLDRVFPDAPGLVARLIRLLVDSVTAALPHRQELLDTSKGMLAIELAAAVETALAAPMKDLVRKVRDRVGRLTEADRAPATPAGLVAPEARVRMFTGPRTVARVKIGPSRDKRKRELGDEAETWALAAVMRPILELDPTRRVTVLEEVADFLRSHAEGDPVEAALAHLPGALAIDVDEEDLLVDLAGLLHLSQHSDAFGYDMLGWLPSGPHIGARPVALEVKSSAGGAFLLSRNEWATAQRLATLGTGTDYAVLVVRRGRAGAVPDRLDLLPDPVRLVDEGQLSKDDDTYRISYRVS